MAEAGVDWNASAREQGLRLVPHPDEHISISQVPTAVANKEQVCIEHGKQVIRRKIRRRQNNLVSSLGNHWELDNAKSKHGFYLLECVKCGDEYVHVVSRIHYVCMCVCFCVCACICVCVCGCLCVHS